RLWAVPALALLLLTFPALTYGQALTITEETLPNGNVGSEYSAVVTASGGSGSLVWRVVDGKLPSGVKLDRALASSSTVIFGTPTREGTYTFTIEVKDQQGTTDTQAFTVVIAGPTPLHVTNPSPTLPGGTVGEPYERNLFANGGVPPYRWEITAGSLPPGLGLKGNVISGTPTTAGTFVFTATVKDKAGATASQEFTIIIQ
ncbi:MAG TPA: Ig domain-containing protein, partial [Candidatus Eisenbacteria bacterium]|nr:Ig domain-containing protein [Candidatus Eisenbacteria bacterium]